MFDFTTVYERTHTGSEKWNRAKLQGMPDGIVPLTIADMEFASAPAIVQALHKVAETGMWGYTYALPQFRQTVTNWMQTHHGYAPPKEWMVHTGGVVHAIFAAVRALTQPGDGVLVQTPVYHPFYYAIERNGRKKLENPLKIENGRYEIDYDDLREKLKQAKMMLFCSPHNPGGRVWSEQDVRKVAQLCHDAGVILFCDEIHEDIIMPGHTHFSVGCLEDALLQNSLIATSASKTFSLAGLSTSTTFVPCREWKNKMQEDLLQTGYTFNNLFGMAATCAAYNQCADWMEEMIAVVHQNARLLQNTLEQNWPQVKMMPLEGTYLAWVYFGALGLPAAEMDAWLQAEAKLYLMDGSKFGPRGEGFFRINLACPHQVVQQALRRLLAAAQKQGWR